MKRLIDFIGSVVIRWLSIHDRELSFHDREDVTQTCALAICKLGLAPETDRAVRTVEAIAMHCPLFHRSTCERASYVTAARGLGLERWKACFRASRRALRIDRRVREEATAQPPDVQHPEVPEVRREKIAGQARHARSLLHAALKVDDSRKRRSTFHTHLSNLRIFTALWAGRMVDRLLCAGNSPDALNVLLHRFRSYCENGKLALAAAATK